MLQMIPGGEVKIPRAVAPILRSKISSTINSTPLKAHTRNAVTRALEAGYITKYTGAAAAIYTTVCDMTGLLRIKIGTARALVLDIPDENYDDLVRLADEKWLPLMMLAHPDHYRYRSRDGVQVFGGPSRHRPRAPIYRGAWMYVHGLDSKMVWEDLVTVIPSLLVSRDRGREVAKRWKAGEDITGEIHVGQG